MAVDALIGTLLWMACIGAAVILFALWRLLRGLRDDVRVIVRMLAERRKREKPEEYWRLG